jgi:hypothetical protein
MNEPTFGVDALYGAYQIQKLANGCGFPSRESHLIYINAIRVQAPNLTITVSAGVGETP